MNGTHDSSEIDSLMERIKLKDAKILELEKEAALLRDEKTMMELEVSTLSTMVETNITCMF